MKGKTTIIESGRRFGKLTIIQETDRHIKPSGIPTRRFLCKCDCGKIKSIILNSLLCNSTTSCGCERTKNLIASRKTHGKSTEPIYKVWSRIKQRCLNEEEKDYKNYGGRGITICEEWMKFENFYRDMGGKYKRGLSIERIDNNGNYELDNCKWITMAKQQKNTRKSVFVKYNGKKMIVSDFEKLLGYPVDYAAKKLRQGLRLEDIIKLKKYERIKKFTSQNS